MGKIALVILGVIILFALIIGGAALSSYNTLVTKRNDADKQWSQVENQMQRRADLIPNIVGTVKGIAGQEKEVFTRIAEARSRLLAATTPEEKIEADGRLTQAMRDGGLLGAGGRFLMITEQYPQLKSNENFMRLQDELAGTENRMAVARRDYNESVTDYNTTKQKFPTVMIAGLMGFQDKPLFKADEGARTAPKVDFSN
ncbi:MAG: LemA family protein [Acidobacteriota bacterium]|nr:MAG: LemA family protein [Acidobacteriota bacterium]